ncbi:uncharacterized protein BJ212DRAFT_1485969 [Suillus subaureus]|uniref:G domain-containing protein n=1 Tax=Suillus subaureus TaxID=48587 RepID=A0A9P7DY35_9AGAM|nr:uncharacterized protein BJ212DRAFT_1485969 [Suillus subaureus]KAG1806208.1 hypothetical protein BJ212DRAFT_1485969 [Suillus subaureus]
MSQTVFITPGPAHNGTNMCNVIIFGEAGAGKSSLIDLITREHMAWVSSNTMGCTTETNAYETEILIPLKLKLLLNEIAGLDEGPEGTVPNMQAQKVLRMLI